jgi:hypothetical protein
MGTVPLTISQPASKPAPVYQRTCSLTVEGLSIRAVAKRTKLSRKTVRRLLARSPERTPPSSEPRPSLLDALAALNRCNQWGIGTAKCIELRLSLLG